MRHSINMIFGSQSKTKISAPRLGRFRPVVESLEDRLVPAIFVDAAGILQISGNSTKETIQIANFGTALIRVTMTSSFGPGSGKFIPASNVTGIKVMALGGNDTIRNMTSLPMEAHGGDGNDLIVGGSGADVLFGDGGDDRLFGLGGNDVLQGGNGNDQLFGGFGDDMLFGGAGVDIIHGQQGNDSLYGSSPSFTDLVRDQLFGGPGNDGFWHEGHAKGLGRSNRDVPGDFASGDFFITVRVSRS